MDTRRTEPSLRAFETNANSNNSSPDQVLTGFHPILPTRILSIPPLCGTQHTGMA